MTTVATRRQHVPDILDCLAQLSNDEVPTPPKLACAMLDLLPKEVWSNPDYKWLDPCCKSGAILREAAARLLIGLETWQPDFDQRREHVFRNMLYGTSVTELTGQVVRRSVYCSRDASGEHSVVRFKREAGNIPFVPTKHNFGADGSENKCKVCGAPKDLERGDKRENYAYAFIHDAYPTEELSKMKFDVIVGNPPFQMGDGGGGGGASALPLYNLFVEQAVSMNPRHLVMITPSRWFSGGKGLDEFRDQMLADKHFAQLIDHPQLYDCFPGVKIRGGVSYWHRDREHDGPCLVTTKIGDEVIGKPLLRNLGAYDVLVRRNEAVSILNKVLSYRVDGQPEPSLAGQVSARKPFGLANERGRETPRGVRSPVLIYGNQTQSYLGRNQITQNPDWIDQWKVLLVKAHGTSGREDLTILGRPIVAEPGSACTETYLVVGRFSSKLKAKRLSALMQTRFVRFLVSLRKITQNMTRGSYRFVPVLPLTRVWTDIKLYERYGLTGEEIAFIESRIKEMPAAGEEEE
ncbi:MAG: Eco57I restriction-modification methylase domain-containing protein [Rhodanobacteraceae bacterium]